jgi:hypothetical protein
MQASNWSSQQKLHGRQDPPGESRCPLPPRTSIPVPTLSSSPLQFPDSPSPTPILCSCGTALRPSLNPFLPPPSWGADLPGCHVSLMTSPGSLGLGQSARGSPSEVLASESTRRGAGRGGVWGVRGWRMGRATSRQVRMRQWRGAWRETECWPPGRTVGAKSAPRRSRLSFPACHTVRPPFGLCKGPLVEGFPISWFAGGHFGWKRSLTGGGC